MKFVTALVVLAVAALSVDASAILPLAWAHQWHQPSLAVSSPWASPVVAKQIISAPAAVWQVAAAPPHHTIVAHSVPAAIELHAAPVVHAAPIAVEGQYVAANRGSVHVAPLPGHAQSAASINLEPAAGTW